MLAARWIDLAVLIVGPPRVRGRERLAHSRAKPPAPPPVTVDLSIVPALLPFTVLTVGDSKAVGGHDAWRAQRSAAWTLAARNMDASVSGAYIATRYETPMTVRLNPMSTQLGIQLSVPSELHSPVEARGGQRDRCRPFIWAVPS